MRDPARIARNRRWARVTADTPKIFGEEREKKEAPPERGFCGSAEPELN
jgi:hypothetical protein